jgi:hypothetical protein
MIESALWVPSDETLWLGYLIYSLGYCAMKYALRLALGPNTFFFNVIRAKY